MFEDNWALTLKEQNVEGEQRFVTMGIDYLGRILVVVYAYREETIRFISARKATRKEREKSMSKKEYDFKNAEQGVVVNSLPSKTRITIRVDTDVLNWFRDRVHQAGGGNYQTLINEALREYIGVRDETLEKVLRKVIREELNAVSK